MKYNQKEMGERIRTLRTEKCHLTQSQLADQLNVTVQMISRYERGLSFCGPEVLVELAEILGTTTDYLMSGKEPEYLRMKKQLLAEIAEELLVRARRD